MGGFKSRADDVFKLLQDPSVGFAIVLKPEEFVLKEALKFYDHLKINQMPFVGFICNRVHPSNPLSDGGELDLPLNQITTDAPTLKNQLAKCHQQMETLAQNDRQLIATLNAKTTEKPLVSVPLFHSDVHAIDALQKIAQALFKDA